MRPRLSSLSGSVLLPIPWSNYYGLARTLLALSPLLTLLATGPTDLFFPPANSSDPVRCEGVSGLGWFCVGGQGGLALKQWVAIAALSLVAAGWRPMLTCLPHWYIAVSFFYNSATPEGGDQISAIAALLLIPACLTDRRRWHWQAVEPAAPPGPAARMLMAVGTIGIVLIKVQVSWIYLQSGIAKLGQDVWVDGSAMYYWFRHSTFGAPDWAAPPLYWISSQPVAVAAMTWSPIVIEVAAGCSLLLPDRIRKAVLAAAFSLHFCIGLFIGLWSFAFAMWGCLLLLLVPMGRQFRTDRATRQPSDNSAPAPAELRE